MCVCSYIKHLSLSLFLSLSPFLSLLSLYPFFPSLHFYNVFSSQGVVLYFLESVWNCWNSSLNSVNFKLRIQLICILYVYTWRKIQILNRKIGERGNWYLWLCVYLYVFLCVRKRVIEREKRKKRENLAWVKPNSFRCIPFKLCLNKTCNWIQVSGALNNFHSMYSTVSYAPETLNKIMYVYVIFVVIQLITV